ncbi:hypothetical protein BDZ94DRAFT_1252729 [Collybia nuda]|uniref:Uncharacterized protein n=1 Tax=Collybia nuda TaxID=64659 RepID=A0A9P5YE34_9AGAR|nr:hypothetical protein BDZ94DRAFT_1252729 [Collybia nuda]
MRAREAPKTDLIVALDSGCVHYIYISMIVYANRTCQIYCYKQGRLVYFSFSAFTWSSQWVPLVQTRWTHK